MIESSTPSRFSAKSVTKYSDAINLLVSTYDTEASWLVPEGSVETFAARFRDAVKAQQKYGYDFIASTISPDAHSKLLRIGTDFQVSIVDGYIVLGKRSLVKSSIQTHRPNTGKRVSKLTKVVPTVSELPAILTIGAQDTERVLIYLLAIRHNLLADFCLEGLDADSINFLIDATCTAYSGFSLNASDYVVIEGMDTCLVTRAGDDVTEQYTLEDHIPEDIHGHNDPEPDPEPSMHNTLGVVLPDLGVTEACEGDDASLPELPDTGEPMDDGDSDPNVNKYF